MRTRLTILAFSLLALPAVHAFRCAEFELVTAIEAPVLFLGEVLELEAQSNSKTAAGLEFGRVRFRILESFRGVPEQTRIMDIKLCLNCPEQYSVPYRFGALENLPCSA